MEARLALGGVAHKPWRDAGRSCCWRASWQRRRSFRAGGRSAVCATPRALRHNAFKIELARRGIVRALTQAARRHAAIADRQANPVEQCHADIYRHRHLPRRRPRQGHRRRPTMPASFSAEGLAYGSVVVSTIAKGRIARIDASEALARRGVLDVLTPREPAAHGRQGRGLQGRCRAGGLAVPPALRRQDHVQRSADRAGGRRGVGDRALRRLAGARRV